jgi:glycine cleavage system aminomethyltransferase T
MVDFGGWDMPIEYSGTVAEHTAVRESVGIFDVSHMGKVAIFGPGAEDFVNSLLANDLSRIEDGQAQYSFLCNDDGGVIDDVIAYKWGSEGIYVVPNAANAATVVAAFRARAPAGITIDDQQATHGIIAVQGPSSSDVLAALGLPTDMEYMSFRMARWQDYSGNVSCAVLDTRVNAAIELVAPNAVLDRPVGCGCNSRACTVMAFRLASDRATRCERKWATPCMVRTSRSPSRQLRRD